MTSIKTFRVDKKVLDTLSANEKKLLPILVEAAKKIDAIFLLQENPKYQGANFYPHDATKAEIEEAAKKNPQILSPFTIVERENGKLTVVPYNIEYQKLLEPIAKLLNDAAKICQNKSFRTYLETLSESLIGGSCQKADIAWLGIKNSNLDIVIGPYERYLDKLFFVKKAYQANVAIIDHAKSEKAKIIRDILSTTYGPRPHSVIAPSAIDIQVQHCLMISGLLGRIFFIEQHFPTDTETTEKYGSRILGYLSAIDYKFQKLIYPIFRTIFEKHFKARYSKDLLEKGNYLYALLSAIAQQLHRYRGSRTRLKDLFPALDEANSVVSGVQHAKHLVLKGVIDQKELEAVMICQICWMFSEWINFKSSRTREDFLKGDALTFNFLIREGALQEKEGISWPNFAKMFFEIENLSAIFSRFLEEGSYREAKEFLTKYLSYENFKAFDKGLSHIKPL